MSIARRVTDAGVSAFTSTSWSYPKGAFGPLFTDAVPESANVCPATGMNFQS